jgi:hypothetical protein
MTLKNRFVDFKLAKRFFVFPPLSIEPINIIWIGIKLNKTHTEHSDETTFAAVFRAKKY